jgi:2-methylcitrate dehydratase PrpD
VHPRALLLAGIQSPATGLKSKWSLYHSAAVALADGAAGEHQYTDARVHDPAIAALRARIVARAEARLAEVEARVTCRLVDGRVVSRHVEKVIGSSERPMSDRDLEEKVAGLCEGILPSRGARTLIDTCWALPGLADAGAIARAAVPSL